MEATSSSTSKKTKYTRGPYKRTSDKLYRSKITYEDGDISRDSEEFINYLEFVRKDIKERFQTSYNRSKVLENIQGLLDCIRKQIRYKQKTNTEEILELKAKVKHLEEIINKTDIPTVSFTSEDLNQAFQELNGQ